MTESQMGEILEQEEDTQKGKFLTFQLVNEYYGIEIRHVTEIIGIQVITEVPELPDYVKGIINLRGKIIPVMDVRLRFNKEAKEYNDRTCVIVIDIRNISIGLIVDSVSEVSSIPDQDIVAPPATKKDGKKYIKAIAKIGSEVKLILDCDKLINDNDIDSINEIV